MFTLFLFSLLIISFIFSLINHKKSSASILLLTLFIFYSASSGILPKFLLNHFEPNHNFLSQPTWEKNNAIVLLGGGTVKLFSTNEIKPSIMAYSRILTTFRLYSQCKNSHHHCVILISGGDPLNVGASEAENYRNELELLGVNHADILIEPNSKNTFQNAKFSHVILKSHSFEKIFLVTSGFHLPRAVHYFHQFGYNIIPVQSDFIAVKYSIIPLGFNLAITDLVLHEYGGMLKYWLENKSRVA